MYSASIFRNLDPQPTVDPSKPNTLQSELKSMKVSLVHLH